MAQVHTDIDEISRQTLHDNAQAIAQHATGGGLLIGDNHALFATAPAPAALFSTAPAPARAPFGEAAPALALAAVVRRNALRNALSIPHLLRLCAYL